MGILQVQNTAAIFIIKVSRCQGDKGRSVPQSVLYKVIAVHESVTILDNIFLEHKRNVIIPETCTK
jgi:hypothetical protein